MSAKERYLETGDSEAPLAFRLRVPDDHTQPLIVMLHGLTGDQTSMWALEAALPRAAGIVTPRGPYRQDQGGFAWNPSIQAWPPLVSEFAESVARLDQLLEVLADRHHLDRQRFILMGFSNGAAMAFAAAMTPMRVPPLGLIVMSGHLPEGELALLSELPIFWSHGIRDNFIPVSGARADVERLRQAGCQVQLCEADVGHKLGTDCRDELRGWYHSHFAHSSEKVG